MRRAVQPSTKKPEYGKKFIQPNKTLKKQPEYLGTRKEKDVFNNLTNKCVNVQGIGKQNATKMDLLSPRPNVYPTVNRTPIFILPPVEAQASCSTMSVRCIKNKIKVIVRVRPKNRREKGITHRTILKALDNHSLLFDPKEETEDFYFHGVKQPMRADLGTKRPNKNMKFTFDSVFGPNSSTEEIFRVSLKPLIRHIVEGFNCSVFAYGATGSGKTYTMLGTYDNRGLAVLMVEELYREIDNMADEYEAETLVSYLEVYNETIKDLLEPKQIINIREDGCHGLKINNLSQHKPSGATELLTLLTSGNNARTQHPTDYNKESSRSHAVFQVSLLLNEKYPSLNRKIKKATAKLVMVDLAGSERGAAAGLDGMRIREGANINKSLLALANCINALADGKSHIPYRDSKLTRLLKDSLSGNCLTVMVANVSPSKACFVDTYNTLKYADRAKTISVTCQRNLITEDITLKSCKNHIQDLTLRYTKLQEQYQEMKDRCDGMEKELSNSKLGMGDGNGHSNVHGQTLQNTTSIAPVTPYKVVRDPEILKRLVYLLDEEKLHKGIFTEACSKSRINEWTMKWIRWRIEVAEYLGKINPSDPNFTSWTRLKNQHNSMLMKQSKVDEVVRASRVALENTISNIDILYQNSLPNFNMTEPFLTVTLHEFFHYKTIEKDIATLRIVEQFNKLMFDKIFEELMFSESIILHSLRFIQTLYGIVKQCGKQNVKVDSVYSQIISEGYGNPVRLRIPKWDRKGGDLSRTMEDLKKATLNSLLKDIPDSSILEKLQSEKFGEEINSDQNLETISVNDIVQHKSSSTIYAGESMSSNKNLTSKESSSLKTLSSVPSIVPAAVLNSSSTSVVCHMKMKQGEFLTPDECESDYPFTASDVSWSGDSVADVIEAEYEVPETQYSDPVRTTTIFARDKTHERMITQHGSRSPYFYAKYDSPYKTTNPMKKKLISGSPRSLRPIPATTNINIRKPFITSVPDSSIDNRRPAKRTATIRAGENKENKTTPKRQNYWTRPEIKYDPNNNNKVSRKS